MVIKHNVIDVVVVSVKLCIFFLLEPLCDSKI